MPELNTDYGVDLLGSAMKATTIKRGLLENAILEQKSKELPDILQHEKKQRAMKTTQEEQATTSNMFNLAKDASNFYLPKMNYGNWDEMKPQIEAEFNKIGLPVNIPTKIELDARAAREGKTPQAVAEAEKFESLAELDQLQKQYELETQRIGALKPPKESTAHDTVTEYNSDGTKQRTLQYNPATNKYDIPVGGWSKTKSQVPNINITDRPVRKQQTQFIDDSDGMPLIFDPGAGEYQRPDGKPIVGNAVRRQPAETIVAGATFETLLDTAQGILSDPKRHDYVGPFDSIKKRFKAATIGDADFAAFRTKIEQMIETSYALSGKQISEKEIKMLEKLRGSINQPDKTFDAAMREYQSWLNNKTKTRQKAFGSQGYSTGQRKERTIVEQRKTKDGRILTKYSDGSIE